MYNPSGSLAGYKDLGHDAESGTVFKSLYFDQDEILDAIQALHCPEGFECDVTYGNGAFYKKRNIPEKCFDLDPLADHVTEADSRMLPLESGTVGSLVFDPPFLTYVRKAREGS